MFFVSNIFNAKRIKLFVSYAFLLSLLLFLILVFSKKVDFKFDNNEIIRAIKTRGDPGKKIDNVGIKMILLWNKFFINYNYMFRMNGMQFRGEHKCPAENCLVTSDRNLRPLGEYDAIVMHHWHTKKEEMPKRMNESQYFVFVSLESGLRNIVDSSYDNFFNWTISYRFDSDFIWPSYVIKDTRGLVVSPQKNPVWEKVHFSNLERVPNTKKRKVVWAVSHCKTDSLRETYVKRLQQYIPVDIYGKCGPFDCPLKRKVSCLDKFKKEYFFYVAFENSHCQDYITEKPYHALLYGLVPIVYGRANYTQFLPPNSYIDANALTPEQLGKLLNHLVDNPNEYAKYFWWKQHYTLHNVFDNPDLHPLCSMCKALNEHKFQRKSYKSLKLWWHGDKNRPVCIPSNITDIK